MLCRVVLLRTRGEKRLVGLARTDTGKLGALIVRGGTASLCTPQPGITSPDVHGFMTLHDVTLRSLVDSQLVLHGWECLPDSPVGTRWKQAWWCRFTPDGVG